MMNVANKLKPTPSSFEESKPLNIQNHNETRGYLIKSLGILPYISGDIDFKTNSFGEAAKIDPAELDGYNSSGILGKTYGGRAVDSLLNALEPGDSLKIRREIKGGRDADNLKTDFPSTKYFTGEGYTLEIDVMRSTFDGYKVDVSTDTRSSFNFTLGTDETFPSASVSNGIKRKMSYDVRHPSGVLNVINIVDRHTHEIDHTPLNVMANNDLKDLLPDGFEVVGWPPESQQLYYHDNNHMPFISAISNNSLHPVEAHAGNLREVDSVMKASAIAEVIYDRHTNKALNYVDTYRSKGGSRYVLTKKLIHSISDGEKGILEKVKLSIFRLANDSARGDPEFINLPLNQRSGREVIIDINDSGYIRDEEGSLLGLTNGRYDRIKTILNPDPNYEDLSLDDLGLNTEARRAIFNILAPNSDKPFNRLPLAAIAKSFDAKMNDDDVEKNYNVTVIDHRPENVTYKADTDGDRGVQSLGPDDTSPTITISKPNDSYVEPVSNSASPIDW